MSIVLPRSTISLRTPGTLAPFVGAVVKPLGAGGIGRLVSDDAVAGAHHRRADRSNLAGTLIGRRVRLALGRRRHFFASRRGLRHRLFAALIARGDREHKRRGKERSKDAGDERFWSLHHQFEPLSERKSMFVEEALISLFRHGLRVDT